MIKGNGQRGFRDEDLPTGDAKRELYELGRDLLQAGGYTEIGMDHFALPHDPLYKAMESARLHRNFMGYTTTQTDVLLGLGVSAISDVGTAFMQNEKDVDTYQQRVLLGEPPILRGHLLTEEDTSIRRLILDIMCRFKTSWAVDDWTDAEWDALRQKLDEFHLDGLLDYDETSLRVRPSGRPFLRNICMAFDRQLIRSQRTERLFSQTV